MQTDSINPGQLTEAAKHLADLIDGEIRATEIAISALGDQIHNATAREHRRAAHNLRDTKCYRLGSTFEPVDALNLDPVALCGWLASGSAGVLALVQIGLSNPGDNIPNLLARLFRSRIGGELRKLGIYAGWTHRFELYRKEVIEFKTSSAFPKQGWRSKPPTANQFYLVEEISLAQQIEKPTLRTREEAFDFIEEAGGNPAFWSVPEMPNLVAALAEFMS